MKKKSNKKEIIWNIINSLLAGGLVFIGAFSDGEITKTGIITAISAAGIVALNLFKDYWSKEKKEYSSIKAGIFIH